MRKLFLLLFAVAFSVTAFAQAGEKGVGVNLLYGTEIENAGVGAKFQYGFTDNWRGEASFNYFLEKDYLYAWEGNLNMHYLFNIADSFRLYPLGGLTVVNWNYDVPGSDAQTKFGINLGGGAEYLVSPNFGVNFEIKYSIVDDVDQAVFGIGATYKF